MSVLSGNDQLDKFSYARVTTDGELYITSPDLIIARGFIPNTVGIFVLGQNPDIDMAEEDIISEGGTRALLDVGEIMSLVSDNAADAAAGTGARAVLLEGLDDDFLEISEVVVLNGVTPVLTLQSFLRINTMTVAAGGSTRTNTGTITTTAQVAGTIQSCIDPGVGIDKSGIFTVPAGKLLIPRRVEFNAAKVAGGGTPLIQFQARIRLNVPTGGPEFQGFDAIMDTGVQNNIVSEFPNPIPLTEKTDIILRALSDSNNTEVRVRAFGILAPALPA